MSWLFTNPTTEQAQIVVAALQEELADRQNKIERLESSLEREKYELGTFLEAEIDDLEHRKDRLVKELQHIDRLLKLKKSQLTSGSQQASAAALPIRLTEHSDLSESTEEEPIVRRIEEKNREAKRRTCHPELKKVQNIDPTIAFIIQRSTVRNQ